MSNELIIARDLTVEIFDSKQTLEEIVAEVKEKVVDFKKNYPDVSTAKGKKEVTTFVSKITKTKTGIESLGVERKAHYLEVCKQIDSLRNFAKNELQAQQDEARLPLTQYEVEEKKRIAAHEAKIQELKNVIVSALSGWKERGVEDMRVRRAEIFEMQLLEWDEYKDVAFKLIDEAVDAMERAIDMRRNYDAEQAELAELRKQAELQRQKNHEEAIRKEAEEKARQEAELALQREREKAEAEAKAAELRIQEEKARAECEKQEYERKLQEAEAKRLADIEAEKARVAAEVKAVEAEEEARRADKAHKDKIFKEISNACIGLSSSNSIAQAIIDGDIPHVKVIY